MIEFDDYHVKEPKTPCISNAIKSSDTKINGFQREKFRTHIKRFRKSLSSQSTPNRYKNKVCQENKISEENVFMTDKNRFLMNRDLLTLKILFVDILLIVCNLSSDISQGVAIWLRDIPDQADESKYGRLKYAIISFAILWAPGIPAAIHFLSVTRLNLEWYRGVIFAFLIILFYPIAPLVSVLIVLWVKPENNKPTKQFSEAQYGANVVFTIHGCISSPLQLCYQSWLALSGVMPFEWTNLEITIKDWNHNVVNIHWPASFFCILFSILT